MTGKLDTQMRTTAQRLIDDYGKPVTIREYTGQAYDPDAGQNVPTYSDHAVNGAVSAYSERLIDGTAVLVGDLRLTVPARDTGFAPSTNDKVVMDGENWSIVNAAPIYSGEQAAAFRLQIRR